MGLDSDLAALWGAYVRTGGDVMGAEYEIEVTPVGIIACDTLTQATTEFHEKRGAAKGAFFGQLWLDCDIPLLKASVFTDDAMEYLHKHIRKAQEMQAKQDDQTND